MPKKKKDSRPQKSSESVRISKTGSKGTKSNVARNEDGVAYEEIDVPATYVPGNAKLDDFDVFKYSRFDFSQLQFLEEYAKDCDHRRAAKDANVNPNTAAQWLKQDKFKAEIEEIQNIWRLKFKMTAETAAYRHIKLFNQLEEDYHKLGLEDRSKMANSLVKASDTYLKASGHFNHGGDGAKDSQVVINIDLGGNAENEEKITIKSE